MIPETILVNWSISLNLSCYTDSYSQILFYSMLIKIDKTFDALFRYLKL